MGMDSNRSEQVLIALRRITHAIDMHSRDVFLRFNLTGPQLFIVREIHRFGGITPEELSKHVEISVSAIHDILDRLGKRGLIREDVSEDSKNTAILSITEAGREILRNAPPLLREQFFTELEKLNEWEQSLILSTLQRVAMMLDENADHPHGAIPDIVDAETLSQIARNGPA